jgi:hypothetical protein
MTADLPRLISASRRYFAGDPSETNQQEVTFESM